MSSVVNSLGRQNNWNFTVMNLTRDELQTTTNISAPFVICVTTQTTTRIFTLQLNGCIHSRMLKTCLSLTSCIVVSCILRKFSSLSRNCQQFMGLCLNTTYKQKCGCTTSSPLTPIVANPYMQEVEKKAFFPGTTPTHQFRYVGDIWVNSFLPPTLDIFFLVYGSIQMSYFSQCPLCYS